MYKISMIEMDFQKYQLLYANLHKQFCSQSERARETRGSKDRIKNTNKKSIMSNLSSHLFKSWTIILEINAPMCFEIPIHWRDLCPHGETTPFQHKLKYIQNTFQLLCALSFQSVEYYLRRIDILVIHRHDIWLSHQLSIQFFFCLFFYLFIFGFVFVCRSLGWHSKL